LIKKGDKLKTVCSSTMNVRVRSYGRGGFEGRASSRRRLTGIWWRNFQS